MRIVTVLLLLCTLMTGGATAAPAADKAKVPAKPNITDVTVDSRNRAIVIVHFDVPVPPLEDLPPADSWQIYQVVDGAKDAPPRVEQLHVRSIDTSKFASAFRISLQLDGPVSKDATNVDVRIVAKTYLLQLPAVTLPQPLGGPDTQVIETAESRDDSDIYFNGSYAAAKGSSAVYDVDAFAGFMHPLQSKDKKVVYGKLGFYGQVRTIQSTTIDPNSFQIYGVYQKLLSKSSTRTEYFQAPYLNDRFAGLEFDLSGNQLNFVTSPIVTFPIVLTSTARRGVQNPGLTAPHLDVTVGAEFVDVLKSALAPTGDWHTRGLLSAALSSGYESQDPPPFFDSLKVSASYQLRLPTSPEIFYDPKFATTDPATGATVTPPLLGTQPRHFIDATFSYNFVKWAGATFETTYGSLPPAFNKTPTTYTFGLTFTLKQKGNGRYSILRP